MEGTLTGALGFVDTLVVLDLGTNYLEGCIPSGLGRLSKLQKLDLSNNRFTGDVDDGLIRNFKSMVKLNLSNNMFTSVIPTGLYCLETHEFHPRNLRICLSSTRHDFRFVTKRAMDGGVPLHNGFLFILWLR